MSELIDNNTKNDSNIDQNIKNRESWIKVLIIGLFAIVLAWKFFSTKLDINFSNLNFSDILSLLLALFAMWISVQFFFKTTETSNNFYNNVYKFTKDQADVLSRIEAKFEEKLNNIYETSSGLKNSFDSYTKDRSIDDKKIKDNTKKVVDIEKSRDKLISSLSEKVALNQSRKQELLDQIKEKNEELDNYKRKLIMLERSRRTINSLSNTSDNMVRRVKNYTKARIINVLGNDELTHVSFESLSSFFDSIKGTLTPAYLNDLKIMNLIDDRDRLTPRGFVFIKSLLTN